MYLDSINQRHKMCQKSTHSIKIKKIKEKKNKTKDKINKKNRTNSKVLFVN